MTTIVPIQGGALAVARHGFGVQLRGVYTPNEIYRSALAASSSVRRSDDPEFFDSYYSYAWCTWDKLGIDACAALCERTRLVTQASFSKSDVHTNYAGLGKPYAACWDSYIAVTDRLSLLRRVAPNLEHLKLLDMGCAGGRMLLLYHAYGLDAYGIEANVAHYVSRSDLVRDRVVLGDALASMFLWSNESFDILICSLLGTVAFPDLPHLFRECRRVLVPSGTLVLDIPKRERAFIGNELVEDYRTYLKTIRDAGLKPVTFYRQQLLVRKP